MVNNSKKSSNFVAGKKKNVNPNTQRTEKTSIPVQSMRQSVHYLQCRMELISSRLHKDTIFMTRHLCCFNYAILLQMD